MATVHGAICTMAPVGNPRNMTRFLYHVQIYFHDGWGHVQDIVSRPN